MNIPSIFTQAVLLNIFLLQIERLKSWFSEHPPSVQAPAYPAGPLTKIAPGTTPNAMQTGEAIFFKPRCFSFSLRSSRCIEKKTAKGIGRSRIEQRGRRTLVVHTARLNAAKIVTHLNAKAGLDIVCGRASHPHSIKFATRRHLATQMAFKHYSLLVLFRAEFRGGLFL
jgi:hypothetical protein